jgi:hypothetical protein
MVRYALPTEVPLVADVGDEFIVVVVVSTVAPFTAFQPVDAKL